MDTVPYERKFFKRNVNQLINKEIINKHRIVDISYGKNVYSTSPTIHISETINFIRGLLIISFILQLLYKYDTKKKPSLLLHRERSNFCSIHTKSFWIKTMQFSLTMCLIHKYSKNISSYAIRITSFKKRIVCVRRHHLYSEGRVIGLVVQWLKSYMCMRLSYLAKFEFTDQGWEHRSDGLSCIISPFLHFNLQWKIDNVDTWISLFW